MKVLTKIHTRFKKLRTADKIKLVLAISMTVAVLVSIPTLAWFSYQKRMATMAKIDSPAKLSLKSGAAEDIIQFKMSGIDTRDGSSKDFVFCVEGEDITKYNIQLAHTTNINFTYSIFRAKQAATGVPYSKLNGETIYYEKIGEALSISYVNGTPDAFSTRILGDNNYEEPSYQAGNSGHIQKFAEPLYCQTESAIIANSNSTDYDELNEDESAFRNYYVLEVSWGPDVTNDKETDLIYLTAQVAQ